MASSSRSDIPTWLNKGARAKLAKETINNIIPKLLKSHPLALNGIKNTELIRYSPSRVAQTTASLASPVASSGAGPSSAAEPPPPPATPRIRIIKSDTLDAVQSILSASPNNLRIRVAALNMASSLVIPSSHSRRNPSIKQILTSIPPSAPAAASSPVP